MGILELLQGTDIGRELQATIEEQQRQRLALRYDTAKRDLESQERKQRERQEAVARFDRDYPGMTHALEAMARGITKDWILDQIRAARVRGGKQYAVKGMHSYVIWHDPQGNDRCLHVPELIMGRLQDIITVNLGTHVSLRWEDNSCDGPLVATNAIIVMHI